MTGSYSQSFTRTDAKHLASKVVADLYQCSIIYGRPSESSIPNYESELVVLLSNHYVARYEFGFQVDDRRVVSWQYNVNATGLLVGGGGDVSGAVYARAKVAGAEYFNFLTYSSAWHQLDADERLRIRSSYPIDRTNGESPIDGNGYWVVDKTYDSSGVALNRKTFRPR